MGIAKQNKTTTAVDTRIFFNFTPHSPRQPVVASFTKTELNHGARRSANTGARYLVLLHPNLRPPPSPGLFSRELEIGRFFRLTEGALANNGCSDLCMADQSIASQLILRDRPGRSAQSPAQGVKSGL